MSAMANTIPIVTTVTKATTKEKTPKEADAAPRVNILESLSTVKDDSWIVHNIKQMDEETIEDFMERFKYVSERPWKNNDDARTCIVYTRRKHAPLPKRKVNTSLDTIGQPNKWHVSRAGKYDFRESSTGKVRVASDKTWFTPLTRTPKEISDTRTEAWESKFRNHATNPRRNPHRT
ncbi:hypothetical protein Tco_0606755 [Tanacetum coccineum]